jgi:hypothetical protein
MTAKELIAELGRFPPDTPVVIANSNDRGSLLYSVGAADDAKDIGIEGEVFFGRQDEDTVLEPEEEEMLAEEPPYKAILLWGQDVAF